MVLFWAKHLVYFFVPTYLWAACHLLKQAFQQSALCGTTKPFLGTPCDIFSDHFASTCLHMRARHFLLLAVIYAIPSARVCICVSKEI